MTSEKPSKDSLDHGDDVTAAEYRECLALLAQAVGARGPAPPTGLKAKLLERVASEKKATGADGVQIWKSWSPPKSSELSGLFVRKADEGGWEKTEAPGVQVRPLNVDEVRRYVTMLVRMEAGASYPRHVHAGAEECYVLEGDLRVGNEVLHAGDYQCAHGGSEHAVQSTEKGCLLLIVSSQDDELV